MTTAATLMEKYRAEASSTPNEASFNDEGESVKVIGETSWTRVLLIRQKESPSEIRIEIELMLPRATRELVPGLKKDEPIPCQVVSELAENTIEHMKYLLNLYHSGFNLELMGEFCLWIATRTFEGLPGKAIFEAICPP
ncbi:MAG: hypothetical protein JSW61_12070 [Candidatus Thorarchaeota archaeon]|nr:MAG: hypothetical protein JSW61_12070 [Candidatus Thorarchaeota archaeon]